MIRVSVIRARFNDAKAALAAMLEDMPDDIGMRCNIRASGDLVTFSVDLVQSGRASK